MELRTASLSSFSAALSHRIKKSDLESSLASCLVLCGIEVILGDTSNWYKHLIGAYEVIRSSSPAELGHEGLSLVPTCFQSFSDGRCLLRSFAYHDILMSICCQSRPLLPGYYFASQDDSLPDSYFGLASKIMYLISEVSMLNADMNEISEPCTQDSFANMATTFSGRAHHLETQLLQWQCSPSGDLALITLAEAYRAAGLIYLYRSLRRHVPSLSATLDLKIAQVVQNAIECLAAMPEGCQPECTLHFPLFMIGGEAWNPSHIKFIRHRLHRIWEVRYFKNILTSLSVLEEVWKARSGSASGNPIADWWDILALRGWKLALA